MSTGNNTVAAARRGLAMAIKRDSMSLRKLKTKRSLESDAHDLDMSPEELEALREDGEEI